jgi:hypothetical protein
MKTNDQLFFTSKKISFVTFILWMAVLPLNAQKISIIESLSGNAWAVQDTVWRYLAKGMGYEAAIVPQSTLDTISNLDTTDALIVSSSNVSFNLTNHLSTIRKYILSGRPAYIQTEYLTSYQGDITFDSLMHTVGADFHWTGTTNGQLTPMNILGTFATTPNAVTSIDYFNYGQAGTGTGVEKFLEFGGNYYGFCYTDTAGHNGTIITISDEDWIWQNKSPLLMENVLYRLIKSKSTPNSAVNFSAKEGNVYPNPFANILTFQLMTSEPAALTIYSIDSRIIDQKAFSNTILLNTGQYAKGIYIYTIKSASGIEYSGKIVKQ